MLISKKINEFVVLDTESVFTALAKMNQNHKRIVFVVSDDGHLVGSFSDGDFRRWLTSMENHELALEMPVSKAMNINPVRVLPETNATEIEKLLKNGVEIVPVVDKAGRVISIALPEEQGIVIGKHTITEDSPAYLIAEIGNNHNGDIKLAKHLVDLAVEANADSVKFQMRDMASLYKAGNDQDDSADLGAQYTMDLLSRFQLTNDELIEVFDYCKTKGLTPLCTPWDLKSLEVLEAYGMEAYKVASADFTNHELLEALAATGKPLICSTGMCTEAEIKASVAFLQKRGVQFVILHCNSTYPTPFKDVNLAYMPRMREVTGALVGYSGHERGISVPVAAVTLGARVVEKHFTIDKSMEGNDHKVSLLPEEFAEMVKQIRQVEEALGNSEERQLTQGEMLNRETLAKSLVASKTISEGTAITRDMLSVKSPGQGLQPIYIDELIGKKAKRDLVVGDFFYESDLKDEVIKAKDYSFNRPFGIPVRYHDYAVLTEKSNFDFVEFHLSYQDMNLNLADFFSGTQSIGFAVHSPELFAGDHIMDLASCDADYRAHSVKELNRVCDITRELKAYFPKTENPVIVINAGGFKTTGFIKASERAALYEQIAAELDKVNQEGVEVIIQTMPPFPWHFGGQSYHNLFVDPDEIQSFCERFNYRICYDVSHSMMACSYYGWDLHDFTLKVGKYTAHMHVVDALGVDGEGVEVGQGDVNFDQLSTDLNQVAEGVQFIPEVWQGHKNNGEGFWKALQFLEDKKI